MADRMPWDITAARADGEKAAPAARRRSGRHLIAVILLTAAVLDLTRCGLVLAAARHLAPTAGLVAAGLAAAVLSVRAARARPMTVQEQPAGEVGIESGLEEILDRQLVSAALQHLSPAHQSVLVETFYRGGTMATVARELGIPHGTARSRLHYALDALRQHLQEHDAIAC